ncbi:MAG: hydroxymethylbilane synthase, partial [Myxococcales bacterium]|nr:hydroxymethylbilane synthase [Myxococcales bacterium]
GGKGLFVKELEEAILAGRADLAVHSMKDMPAELPEGLAIVAVPAREDPRDVAVVPSGKRLLDLPAGARVGTSSLRRKIQTLALRPDLVVEDLRGNIDTRLRKAAEGKYDAILLAAAGLRRMGWIDRATELLDPGTFLPAVGQGALAIEARSDGDAVAFVSRLDDPETRDATRAERAMLARLGAGCQTPVAGHATVDGGEVFLRAFIASLDGRRVIRREARAPRERARELGRSVADALLGAGAEEILAEIQASGS